MDIYITEQSPEGSRPYTVADVTPDRCLDVARQYHRLGVVRMSVVAVEGVEKWIEGEGAIRVGRVAWGYDGVALGLWRHEYYCASCGSTEVEHAMWIALNKEHVGDAFGSWCEDDSSYCGGCDENGIQIDSRYVPIEPIESKPDPKLEPSPTDYHAELLQAGWTVETYRSGERYVVRLTGDQHQHQVTRDTLRAALQAAWAGESDERVTVPPGERDDEDWGIEEDF